MHCEQRRDAVEPRPVADAGGNRHDRGTGETTDDAGECSLHAGNHHHCVCAGDIVEAGEQAVEPGHADIIQLAGIEAMGGEGDEAFVHDGLICSAG